VKSTCREVGLMEEMVEMVGMLWLLLMARLQHYESLVGGGSSGRSEGGMVREQVGMDVGGEMSC